MVAARRGARSPLACWSPLLGAALWAAACSGPPPEPTGPAPTGWLATVTASASAVPDLIAASSSEGWVAVHRHDHAAAHAAFSGTASVPASSAAWALQRRHQQIDRLADRVTRDLLDLWRAAGSLPADDQGVLALEGLQAWCHGTPQARSAVLGRLPAPTGADDPWSGLRAALADQPLRPEATDPFSRRLELHSRARSGDIEALEQALATPVLEHSEDGLVRRWFDPCAHQALAAGWGQRASAEAVPSLLAALDAGALDGALFMPWSDAADLRAALSLQPSPDEVLAHLPSLSSSGLGRLDLAAATPEDARRAARALTAALDRWRAEAAHAPGGPIALELQIFERQRALWVTVRADDWLRHARPDLAMAVLEPALDASNPEVSPLNPPELFLLLAEARVATGRARQALDALRPLADIDRSLTGLHELLADLAVVQGIHRQGDSKEN